MVLAWSGLSLLTTAVATMLLALMLFVCATGSATGCPIVLLAMILISDVRCDVMLSVYWPGAWQGGVLRGAYIDTGIFLS